MPYAYKTVLLSCGTNDPLPPPGADQGAEIQLWQDDGSALRVSIDRIEQQPGQDFAVSLQGVTAEWPFEDHAGLMVLRAPSGRYAAQASDQFILQGPIIITGMVDGQPLYGEASLATFERATQTLRCDNIMLITPTYQLHADAYRLPRNWQQAEHGGDSLQLNPTPDDWQDRLKEIRQQFAAGE